MNIIWLLIAVWILYKIIKGIDSHFKSRRFLTPGQMANYVMMGKAPTGEKMTKEYINKLINDPLLMDHYRAMSEAAQKEINARSTGQIKDNSRNLAKPKKNRPVKWF